MSNHTPGPWRVVDRRNRDWAALHIDAQPDSKGAYSVASVGGVADMPESEREANARLIAAAPQLLEALEALDTLMDFSEPIASNAAITFDNAKAINAAMQQARTAIAAAKGDGR